MNPHDRLLVGWLVDLSVSISCKGREVTLQSHLYLPCILSILNLNPGTVEQPKYMYTIVIKKSYVVYNIKKLHEKSC